MRPIGFFIAASLGIAFQMSLYILLADSIREPILNLLEVIRTYQLPGTIVLAGSIVSYQVYKRRFRDRANP
jgi:small ligand-binding sensory domain FIST